MSGTYLETSVEFLKGVGPERAKILKSELEIHSFGDLLHHFPFRYVDRTRFYTIKEISSDMPYIQLRGKLVALLVKGEKRKKYLVGKFVDDSSTIDLVWFRGLKWISNNLQLNAEYVLFGKPSEFNGVINIVHPELELSSESAHTISLTMQPVYNTTEKMKLKGMDSRFILRLQKKLIEGLPKTLTETLSDELLHSLKLMPLSQAFINMHFPSGLQAQKTAEYRLKFEELFYLQMRLLHSKLMRIEKSKGYMFDKVGEAFNEFYHNFLPFPLTNAQKKVIKEIRADFATGKQMNRLLQGDVGSGKTLVGVICMLIAKGNGCQSCLMAPTEILAKQHADSISALVKDMNVNVALLTGSVKGKARKKLLEQLEEGSIDWLIGTHALIEDAVKFQNLGLVIIDEQHRFGVEQRSKLWKKGMTAPHVLVMTATPIPRTLAMTLYGDLDVSVIDEMPPGRKAIQTVHRFESDRLRIWKFMKDEIAKGRQIYIVYPLIEESEKMDLNNLMQGYESICRDFPQPQFQVSIVHGRMKAADKDFEMQRFLRKETQIMVATTVIEVGVNVPNASVMVIENAERFGLSQLHQLRGRVGRGADQSYCILVTGSKLGDDARLRVKTMCDTNDGFIIAEVDLNLRGPGDAEGTRQSGDLDLKLSSLTHDQAIVLQARDKAIEILKKDPQLILEKNVPVNRKLHQILQAKGEWGKIS